jgi:hypothetical protein
MCELCDPLISTNLFITMLSFCVLFHLYVVLFGEIEKKIKQHNCANQMHRAVEQPDLNGQ